MGKRFGSTIRIIVALFLSVFMTNFAPVMTAYAAPQPATSDSNKEEYWEGLGYGVCTKIDYPGNTTATSYTLGTPAAGTYWSLLVIKASSVNEVYTNPQVGVAYNAPQKEDGTIRNVSHVIFCYKPTPSVEVTATTPTHVDPCGTANDKYTITATTGVIYKVDTVVTPAGTYTGTGTVNITAEAEAGYTLTGAAAWSFTFATTPCVIEVTPATPTSVDPCGKRNDMFTIPSTTGVIYKVNNQVVTAGDHSGSGTVVVTAEAEAGYVLVGGTYSWTLTFTDVPCPITVTPKVPKHVDLCGTKHDFYTIPSKSGVTYQVNGSTVSSGVYPGSGTVVVTAIPSAAHITLAGVTSWTFNFTNTPCVVVDVDSTEECVERGATNGVVTVDVTNNRLTHQLFRATVDGTEQLKLVAPGETYTFTFNGFGPGTYDVTVEQLVFGGISPAAPVAANLDIAQTNSRFAFHWETVYESTATIDECPREEPTDVCPLVSGTQTTTADCPPGQVLGDSAPTGHTLSTSTSLPSVLPATGAAVSPTGLLPLAGAVITYLIASKKNSRKKAEA